MFTAVESAAIAVVYAVLITALVYRKLTLQELHGCVYRRRAHHRAHPVRHWCRGLVRLAARVSQVPAAAVQLLTGMADDKNTILLLMILMLLVLGTFMDLAPLIIICTPIFLPVAKAIGINPVHFGVILILKGGLGLITPPFGSVLFVGAAIGKISIGEILKTIWPFYLAVLAGCWWWRSCRSCRSGCRRRSSSSGTAAQPD